MISDKEAVLLQAFPGLVNGVDGMKVYEWIEMAGLRRRGQRASKLLFHNKKGTDCKVTAVPLS
ncbi:hypothetical protein MHH52_11025 [Paenibacillus sp. FSL K6-0276]|uniref:hypothetical protein n=1 Tax=unclassified Paenibacillus TaxID=185978 RepID=UPI0028B20C79|nr:hypothetical protein [Paenibacillus sp.]